MNNKFDNAASIFVLFISFFFNSSLHNVFFFKFLIVIILFNSNESFYNLVKSYIVISG